MMKCGRSCIAAFMACAILLLVADPAYPSTTTEAGHKYSIACQRLADLRKSPKKKKYRSYWVDCIRTFELVEKKYPKSPSAGDACFDRAGIYQDLYVFNKYSKDLDKSLQLNGTCQAAYPNHVRAPEALYHIVELALDYKKDKARAAEAYARLTKLYPDSSWSGKAKARITTAIRMAPKKQRQEAAIRNMPVPMISSPDTGKPEGTVKSVRYWSGGAYTRIVIDQSTPIEFQARELKDPDRLVFDLLNTRMGPSVDKGPLAVNDGILRQVRTRQHAPNVVRVVLDLASIKSYVAFPLQDPDRLVIDVTGEGGKTAEPLAVSAGTGTSQKTAPIVGHDVQAHAAPQPPLTLPSKTPNGENTDGATLSLSRQL